MSINFSYNLSSKLGENIRSLTVANSISARKKALKGLINYLQQDRKAIYALTNNSLQLIAQNTYSSADSSIDWCSLIDLVILLLSDESSSNTKRPNAEILESLKFLTEQAESNCNNLHLLSSSVARFMEELVKLLEESSDLNKLQLFAPLASEIIRTILTDKIYCKFIPLKHLHFLFNFYSEIFVNSSDSASSATNSTVNDSLNIIPSGLQRHSLLCAQILSLITMNYPYPYYSFFQSLIFPFFSGLILQQKTHLETPAVRLLFTALNSALSLHAMTILSLYRAFLHHFLPQLHQISIKTPLFKLEIVQFTLLALKINQILPENNKFPYFSSLNAASLLYRMCLEELSKPENSFFDSFEGKNNENSVGIDPNTLKFFVLTAFLVNLLEENKANTRNTESVAENNIESSKKRRKIDENSKSISSSGINSAETVWQILISSKSSNLFIPINYLKFFSVFLRSFPRYFSENLARSQLLGEILESLERNLVKGKLESKVWSLICLESCLAIEIFPDSVQNNDPSHYSNNSAPMSSWNNIFEYCTRKLLFEERKILAKQALQLLISMKAAHPAANFTLSPSQSAQLQLLLRDLPFFRLLIARNYTEAKVIAQFQSVLSTKPKQNIIKSEINSEKLLASPDFSTEKHNFASIFSSLEVDINLLRILLSYRGDFDFSMLSNKQIRSEISEDDSCKGDNSGANFSGEERLFHWLLAYRYGSNLFSVTTFSETELFQHSQVFAASLLLICRLPFDQKVEICAGSKPRVLADMRSIDVTDADQLYIYLREAQFAKLVESAAKPMNKTASNGTKTVASSSSSLHHRLVAILQEYVQNLIAEVRSKMKLAVNLAESVNVKEEELHSSVLLLLHYIHVIAVLLSVPNSVPKASAPAADKCHIQPPIVGEAIQNVGIWPIQLFEHLNELLVRLFNQLSLILAHFQTASYNEQTRTVFAYMRKLLKQYSSVFTYSAPNRGNNAASSPNIILQSASSMRLYNCLSTLSNAVIQVILAVLRKDQFHSSAKPTTSSQQVHSSDEFDSRDSTAEEFKSADNCMHDDFFDSETISPSVSKRSSMHPTQGNNLASQRLSEHSYDMIGNDIRNPNLLTDSFEHSSFHFSNYHSMEILFQISLIFLNYGIPLNDRNRAEIKQWAEKQTKANLLSVAQVNTYHSLFSVFLMLCIHNTITKRGNKDLIITVRFLKATTEKIKETQAKLLIANEFLYCLFIFFLQVCKYLSLRAIQLSDAEEAELAQHCDEMFKLIIEQFIEGVSAANRPSFKLTRTNRILQCYTAVAALQMGLSRSFIFAATLLNHLEEEDYVVRLFTATQAYQLVQISEKPLQVFTSFEQKAMSILTKMAKEKKYVDNYSSSNANASDCVYNESSIRTLLACLANMATTKLNDCERITLLHLCKLWQEKPEIRPEIGLVYDELQAALGYKTDPTIRQQKQSNSSSSLFLSPQVTLLEEHLDFILMEWLADERLDLLQFPRELLSKQSSISLEQFLHTYQSYIMPALTLYFNQQPHAFKQLTAVLAIDVPSLLKRHFGKCASRFYALYSQSKQSPAHVQAKQTLEFFNNQLKPAEFNKIYHSQQNEMLCHLVDYCVLQPEHHITSQYDIENFKTTLNQLATAENTNTEHYLVKPGTNRIYRILLHIRMQITKQYRADRQYKLFQLFQFISLDILSETLARGGVFCTIIYLGVALLNEFDERFPQHQFECARFISRFVTKFIRSAMNSSNNTDMSVQELGRHFRYIVAELVNYAQKQAVITAAVEVGKASSQYLDRHAIVGNIFKEWINILPNQFLSQLQLLPPLPNLSPYSHINAHLTIHSSLQAEIQRFLLLFKESVGISVKSALLFTALDHMKQQLVGKQQQLNVLLATSAPVDQASSDIELLIEEKKSTQENNDKKDIDGYELVSQLLGALLSLVDDSQSSSVRSLAVQCIGLIGIVDPVRVNGHDSKLFCAPYLKDNINNKAQSNHSTIAAQINATDLLSSNFSRWHVAGGGIQLAPSEYIDLQSEPLAFYNSFHHELILILLLQLCSHNDSNLVNSAHCTLQQIFQYCNDSIHSSYNRLHNDYKVYLSSFAQLKVKQGNNPSLNLNKLSASAEDQLWNIQNTGYSDWICNLTHFLCLARSSDAVLQHCAAICLISSDFASRIFPYVIFSIIIRREPDGTQQLVTFLNAIFRFNCNHFDFNNASTINHVTAVLSALQYTREQYLIIYRQPIVLEKVEGRGSFPLKRQKEEIAQHIENHFFSKLNLLPLAQTCLTVNYPYSALVYLEDYNKRHLTNSTVDNSSAMRDSIKLSSNGTEEADSQLFRELLMWCYSCMNDNDSLQGILTHATSLSQSISADVLLAEHENKFNKSLQIYDSLLQFQHHNTNKISSNVSSLVKQFQGDSLIHNRFALQNGLINSLQKLGCSYILNNYCKQLLVENNKEYTAAIKESHLEAAWRVAKWDLTAPINDNTDWINTESGIQCSIFNSFKGLNDLIICRSDAEPAAFHTAIHSGQVTLLSTLSNAGPESINSIFPAIVHSQLLADIQQVYSTIQSSANTSNPQTNFAKMNSDSNYSTLLNTFEQSGRARLMLLSNNFDLVEPILAMRGVLFGCCQSSSLLARHLRFLSSFARVSNQHNIAHNAIREAAFNQSNQLQILDEIAIKLEEAQLNWSEGSTEQAIRTVKYISTFIHNKLNNSSNDEELKLLHVHSLLLIGEWLSVSHSENSSVIESYLHRAQSLCKQFAGSSLQQRELHKSHYQMACFYDRLFLQQQQKQLSAEHENARDLFRHNAEKLKKLEQSLDDPTVKAILTGDNRNPNKQNLLSKQQFVLRFKKEHGLDAEQHAQFDQSVANSMEKAVENYAAAMNYSENEPEDSHCLYRLIALWFNHYAALQPSNSQQSQYKQAVMRQIAQVPSRKFLPLLYQIASRLSSPQFSDSESDKLFKKNVNELILRLCVEHPYHSLYQIFALAHGDQVNRVSQSVQGGFESNLNRIQSAINLVAQLKGHIRYGAVVAAQEKLVDAYVDIGNKNYGKAATALKLKDTPLANMKPSELQLIAVPTATIPIRIDLNYNPRSLLTIERFDSTFKFANSGINKPLILGIQCNNGLLHRQLLKPADDLRQDAVMEQLFELVNELLHKNRETRARDLRIRTYNVVPLTPGVGLVEWVENTSSLADCLTHSTLGAHTRYFPPNRQRDYRQCMLWMQDAHLNNKSLLPVRFKAICEDFQPVFGKFFLDLYPSPVCLFQRRIAYTRSVAVNSMIGYILGLGDRHIQNILFDKSTAEIINIDLGVAFDTGKILKTPEIVPFRLTRDMIDAFGITGVEGSFKRTAEETLAVLRHATEMLLTVLQVFLHDPLYKWALSPNKIQQLRPAAENENDNEGNLGGEEQGRGNSNGDAPASAGRIRNFGAERAMLAVKQRLIGSDYSQGLLSISGQVNWLISEASHPDNLAKMYFGWSAWV
jgi:hypothetical protein